MEFEELSADTILLNLLSSPASTNQLIELENKLAARIACDVVIDFSKAEFITSEDIGRLTELRKFLAQIGRKLVLVNVSFRTKCIFTVVGIDQFFNFADDIAEARQTLNSSHCPPI